MGQAGLHMFVEVLRPLLLVPKTHREERDQRRNDIEHLATSLVGKVNECVAALDEGVEGAFDKKLIRICCGS